MKKINFIYVSKKISLFGLVCVIITTMIGCGSNSATYFAKDDTQINSTTEEVNTTEVVNVSNTADKIRVYVCGQVKKPAVYTLDSSARICDVIEKAGGYTKKAAKEYLNLAKTIEDGQKIYVPAKDEVKQSSDETKLSDEFDSNLTKSDTNSGKVNINTASKEELVSLNGIGEARAESILAYRSENGAFSKIDDIMKVSGIGKALFSKIKDNITI